ncbi:MAG: hypothetical protein WCW14_00795 [Candidatus Paceibacterota bacterium]|jgi:type IV secretory pathway VirB4 component
MATSKATQNFIPIQEVRDGIVILKDKSLRAIIMVSSVNFALKSKDEQQAITFQFQNFLNSLDFSIQIFIESRKRDIRPYINLLEEQYKNQYNNLMKIQIREYIEFIKSFSEIQNIMEKRFYIIVPYSPPVVGEGKGFSPFGKKQTDSEKAQDKTDIFAEHRTQIEQRVGIVQQGLVRMGLKSELLGTDHAVELYYGLFNPGDSSHIAPRV